MLAEYYRINCPPSGSLYLWINSRFWPRKDYSPFLVVSPIFVEEYNGPV
jgi:hypothetical protein